MLAEHEFEELRRQFVVLLVGVVGVDRDGLAAEFFGEGLDPPTAVRVVEGLLLAQLPGDAAADRPAEQGIGDHAAFDELHHPGHRVVLGNQGKNALVSCWYRR